MRLIKIRKGLSHGDTFFYEFVSGLMKYREISEFVEAFCENEPSGSNRGYEWDWNFVFDSEIIAEKKNKKIQSIEEKINYLNNLKKELLE